MIRNTISIDNGTDAQNAGVRNEMEQTLGGGDDPLAILIAEENEDCDCVYPHNRCADCPLAS